jgi:predicted MFS family arabinose efflux permease
LKKREPLLQMRLFGHRPFAIGGLVSFIYGFGIFGSTYLLPVFLQMALGYTPSQAGLVLLPAGLALAFTMPFAGRLADRWPAGPLVAGGVLLLALSLVLTATVTSATAYVLVIAWVLIGRVGLAIIHPALSIGSVRGLEPGLLPQALSVSSFMRQLGGSFGISVSGVLLDWRLSTHAGTGAAGADSSSGMMAGFHETFYILAAVSLAAAVAGGFIGSGRSRTVAS